jgi:Holliday junction resolvase
MAKDESKFWQEVKKNIKQISFTRLESWASAGVPDLLCYNEKGKFFTIELKVEKRKKLTFSPHQISFHMKHSSNTFILAKALDPLAIKLYEGRDILKLVNREPCTPVAESWTKVQEHLVNVT